MVKIVTFPKVATAELQRVANIQTKSLTVEDLPATLSVLQWIAIFDPHVSSNVVDNAVTWALDEPATGLAEDDDYLAVARTSCAIANSLPARLRRPASIPAQKIQYDVSADEACTPGVNWSTYWWGYTYYMNHCAIQQAELFFGSAGAMTGFIASLASGPPGWILGAIAVYLAVDLGLMQAADAKCGDAGADLSGTWASVGTPWVKPVC